MLKTIEIKKLQDANIDSTYFPYCEVDCFIKEEKKQDLNHDFPSVSVRGSVPASKLTFGNSFKDLIDDLYSDELKDVIAKKFDVDLSCTVPLLTIRGHTDLKDGKIHTDTKSKIMTILLYLNEGWQETTGNLRLLRDGDNLENYFAEVSPTFGKLLVFKVTPNCWHGHHAFEGQRRTLQLNYVTSQDVVKKELGKHARSYTLKNLIHKIKTLFNEKNSIS